MSLVPENQRLTRALFAREKLGQSCVAGKLTRTPHPMQMNDQVYRFAGFTLDPVTGELRTGQSTTTLQEKPLLLLLALLDHPRQVVSREQLRERMWSNRTVVEFDQGINAAIKKVRDALGDPVARPRYI